MADSFPEDGVNFFAVPSLRNMAAIKISIVLWTHHDVIDEIVRNKDKLVELSLEKSFVDMQGKVRKKLWLLPLPTELLNKILSVLKPIGLQVLRFVFDNVIKYSYDHFRTSLSEEKRALNLPFISWTMRGAFDEEKVFMMLLRKVEEQGRTGYECMDYRDACKFCLEVAITHLYEKVYPPVREHMKVVEHHSENSYWVAYWTCKLSNDMASFVEAVRKHFPGKRKKKKVYQYLMEHAIKWQRDTAVRYLWAQMREKTRDKHKKNVVKWTEAVIGQNFLDNALLMHSSKIGAYQTTNSLTDIMCFFLSNIGDSQKHRELLENYSLVILQSLFLTWPWQELFEPMFRTLIHHCSGHDCAHLLSDISSNIESPGVTKVFRDIWRATPKDSKRSYIEWLVHGEANHDDLLGKSIRADDMSCVHLVLDDAAVGERKELIFRLVSETCEFYLLISRDKLHLIDELTGRYGLSETNVAYLKRKASKRFLEFFQSTHAETEVDDVWAAGQNLIRWCFQSRAEIDDFKAEFEPMGRLFNAMVDCFIRKGDFTNMDVFFSWCGLSEETIPILKREIAFTRRFDVLKKLCSRGKLTFEKFVEWCCRSEKEISKLKKRVSETVWANDKTCATFLASVLISEIDSEVSTDGTEYILEWVSGPERVLEAKRNLLFSDACLEAIQVLWNIRHNGVKFDKFVDFFRPLGPSAFAQFKQFVYDRRKEGILNRKSRPKWLNTDAFIVLLRFGSCISRDTGEQDVNID